MDEICLTEWEKIPHYVRVRELCISLRQQHISGLLSGKEICQLHHSALRLLAPTLANCFFLQFLCKIQGHATKIRQFIDFFNYFDANYVPEVRYKALKIIVHASGLTGNDVAEQLFSPLCTLSRVICTEIVTLRLDFFDCSPSLDFVLPTPALINRLCLSSDDDSNSPANTHLQTMHQSAAEQHRQFYLTISTHFHKTPPPPHPHMHMHLKLPQIERNIEAVILIDY